MSILQNCGVFRFPTRNKTQRANWKLVKVSYLNFRNLGKTLHKALFARACFSLCCFLFVIFVFSENLLSFLSTNVDMYLHSTDECHAVYLTIKTFINELEVIKSFTLRIRQVWTRNTPSFFPSGRVFLKG